MRVNVGRPIGCVVDEHARFGTRLVYSFGFCRLDMLTLLENQLSLSSVVVYPLALWGLSLNILKIH